jgi:deoxyribodipyrimidine photo-lyase
MDGQEEQRWKRVIVWFRRDLRLNDHPALSDAIRGATEVVPLFVLDDALLRGPSGASPRATFLAGVLTELDVALRQRGSGLLVREGSPARVVPDVAEEIDADAVLASRDVTPYSHRRDRLVAEALEQAGRSFHLRPGLLLAEPEDLHTADGSPYKVFSAFWRALRGARRRPLRAPPSMIPAPAAMRFPALDGLARVAGRTALRQLPEPGEAAALERLRTWVQGGLATYGDRRSELSGEGTSHLSADLHMGSLSPLQVETTASEAQGEAALPFVRQLAWREFYQHSLWHRRVEVERVAADPLIEAFRPESADPDAVRAWREGRTGVPTVDAAMRQLSATGWMSNRARLVVASFLTRHLLIDYRVGERHFLEHLIDGDVANNLGGWEWTAGVGSDPQPWFRIFNPVLQGRRFDPDGAWVRTWVPEVARVPDRYVHAPWEMPVREAVAVGLRLGETYPRPIVDLKAGRARALAAFEAATSESDDHNVARRTAAE